MGGVTLVIGATGNVGSQVVRELRERDVPVRAFVRDADRAAEMLGDGVDLSVGDLADPTAIRRALTGADRLFLSCANVPGQMELEKNAIDAAQRSDVDVVVKLSAAAASVDSPLLFPRWQGQIEQHLRDAQLPAVVLRPVDYMTNVLSFADGIRRTGVLFAPLGGARTAMIDPRDVGAVAALALTEAGHVGNSYTLTGPEAITYDTIVGHLSEATGRTIGFVDVSDDAAHQELRDQGMPEAIVDFLVNLFAAMRRGLAAKTTDTVAALTGHPPRSFAEWARDHADRFTP